MPAASLRPADGDVELLRRVFGAFPTGVVALCAEHGGAPVGMAATSFTSVSIDPPLVSVCVQNSSRTWPRLRAAPRLGLSVLSSGQDLACRALAAKDGDRFGAVTWSATDRGAVFVDGAAAMIDTGLYDELPAGDHTIAVLEVHAVQVDPDTAPLIFHGSRFRRLADP